MPGARSDKAAGDARHTQPKGSGHRLRTGFVLPTGQAHQDLPEQARICRPRAVELFVRGQEDLAVRRSVAYQRNRDGQFLIGQVDRASLLPPADHACLPARPTVACPAKATTSASNASPTACGPNGMRAWISATFVSISPAGNPEAAADTLTSFILPCR